MRVPALLFSVAVLSVVAPGANADLAVTIPSEIIQAGSTDPLVVTVTGSDVMNITSLNLVFDITPETGLQFVYPTDASLDPTLNDSHYVLYGQSTDLDIFNTTFGNPIDPDSSGYATLFSAADFGDGNPFSATANPDGSYDLASLVIQFPANHTSNPAGDLFSVTLDLTNSYYTTDPGQAVNQLFTASSSGIITVTSNAGNTPPSTPEPATLVSCLSGIALIGGVMWLRCRSRSIAGRPSEGF